jgi:hypothetical protein
LKTTLASHVRNGKIWFGGEIMKRIIIILLIGIILFSIITFAGDNDEEYSIHSTNPQVQTEFSE